MKERRNERATQQKSDKLVIIVFVNRLGGRVFVARNYWLLFIKELLQLITSQEQTTAWRLGTGDSRLLQWRVTTLGCVLDDKRIHKREPPHRSRGRETDCREHSSKEEERATPKEKRGLQLLWGDMALSLSMNTFDGLPTICT